MNATEIKTRHGLILQALTAKALCHVGYSFAENHQYDEVSEVPDFLLPDADSPQFMVEVHQTDARDSFRMKILRAFTAVIESKVHYGDNLISVNILFGDPQRELPESNVKALCGYFDVNLIPRYSPGYKKEAERLENLSLEMAATEDLSVMDAAEHCAEEFPKGVEALALMIKDIFKSARTVPKLKRLWQLERKRIKSLGPPPEPGAPTYHKRNILRSLFFSDQQFAELISKENSSEYSQELCDQLVRCKLVEREEQIWGDELIIDPVFLDFLRNPEAPRFRKLCQDRLEDDEGMKWFFEDIQKESRRITMADKYLTLCHQDYENIAKIILSNLTTDAFEGISHSRCWIADLLARELNVPHNKFNMEMAQDGYDHEKLGNPFNQISYKAKRFMGKPQVHSSYCQGVQNIAQKIKFEQLDEIANDSIELSNRLLELRLDGAIKLQKLNPIYLVLESLCRHLKLHYKYEGTLSIISDMANAARGVGKFNVYHISNPSKKRSIAVPVSVHDANGDHKSKEWGARRRALGYRYLDGNIKPAPFDEALFIIDGDWEAKHVERLHRAGWNRIIRLDRLEETLKDIFGSQEKTEIEMPEIEELPMAAETREKIHIGSKKEIKNRKNRKAN